MKYKKKQRHNEKSVYIFQNIVTDVTLYVNAENTDHACQIFDSCGFKHRSSWKILLELGVQPSDGKKKK
jgi:hypothetical protein